MKTFTHEEDATMGFQIAPMIDVVFVIMLFFMASAGQQVIENELEPCRVDGLVHAATASVASSSAS